MSQPIGIPGKGWARPVVAPATDPSHSLSELVEWILAGELEVPIAAVYPLDRVQEAFREIEQRHTRGKIVLRL